MYIYVVGNAVYTMPFRVHKVVCNPELHELLAKQEDPEAFAVVAVGAGGALCLGSAGTVIGTAVGGTAGCVLGAIPAPLTFGLSLPIGTVLGGAGGLVVGMVTGGGVGFA